jgi:protein involved in polysaccharide export with SLBB domain
MGKLPLETTAKKPIFPASTGAIVSLEGAVDPKTYILGPGDKLEFDVWGAIEEQHEFFVAPDGRIAVPGVGAIQVAGLTVSAADSLVHRLAQPAYQRATLTLRLTGVRKMKASIGGAVEAPGVYEIAAVDRLTALIFQAQGLLLPEEESDAEASFEQSISKKTPAEQRRAREEFRAKTESKPRASLRFIEVVSKDGSRKQVDLQMFFATGNLEQNPVMKDGDVVSVPLTSRQTGVVNVFGAVKNPGEFEFVPGDRCGDLVKLAGGFREDALTGEVTIVRFTGDARTQSEIQTDLSSPEASGAVLQSDDRIFVRKKPDYKQKYEVTVKGEVRYPGIYSIENDRTPLSQLIETCGGLTDRANLYSARVVRRALEDAEDPEFERLRTLTVSEMTDMEYEYFKIRSREEAPGVVVNFKRLLLDGDKSVDITLQDKDEIEIPTVSPTVKVAGQVNNPGLVRYVAGKDFHYYVQQAGDYSWNARTGKIRLIKAHTGTWMKPKKSTPIEIGDTIFVPEKQELDWWELSKDLLLVASQVATVLIMIRSL